MKSLHNRARPLVSAVLVFAMIIHSTVIECHTAALGSRDIATMKKIRALSSRAYTLWGEIGKQTVHRVKCYDKGRPVCVGSPREACPGRAPGAGAGGGDTCPPCSLRITQLKRCRLSLAPTVEQHANPEQDLPQRAPRLQLRSTSFLSSKMKLYSCMSSLDACIRPSAVMFGTHSAGESGVPRKGGCACVCLAYHSTLHTAMLGSRGVSMMSSSFNQQPSPSGARDPNDEEGHGTLVIHVVADLPSI